MAGKIEVRPVRTRRELKTLLRLPWKIYKNDPNWVPPLLFDVARKFNKKHNHFFDHGDGEYFLAWRGSEPVGRITAQFDLNYDEHWGGRTGMFGWFECIEDKEVAQALFDSAADWLRKQGRDKMQGPFNFNINDECGLLIDGFDTPPMFMMTHNPPYYRELYEACGLKKAMDLYAYRIDATVEPPEDIKKFAAMVMEREDIIVRNWNMKDHAREMDRWLEVYNSAWEKNWGAVKMSEKEFKAHSLELRLLADPELIFIAETRQGEVIGCAFTLPNLNEYLIKLNGRLYKLLPFLWYDMAVKKKYESCRVVTLGVKEQWRRSGIGAVFYVKTLEAAKRKGYKWGEGSWILEVNDPMNRALKKMGGKIYKTYRIYETGI